VSRIEPLSIPLLGLDRPVQLWGRLGNGSDVVEVLFGGVPGSIVAQTSSWVSVRAPAAAVSGLKTLTARSLSKAYPANWMTLIRYNEAGNLTSFAPRFGSQVWNSSVVITGTNLCNGSDVERVTVAGITATVLSQAPTRIVVLAPAVQEWRTGAVEVKSTYFGVSRLSSFMYPPRAPPLLCGVPCVALDR
jgi:hypothetical protein